MSDWLLDYSADKLYAPTIRSTPIGPDGERAIGAVRYIDAPNMLGRKHTNKAEYDSLVGSGMLVLLVFEVNEDDPLGGFGAGVANARRALAGADYLGYRGPIFFCADRWFVTPGKPTITPEAFQSYLDGAASVLGRGRVGAYGFADAMDAAVGHADWFWQCGARKVVRPHVHLWQDNNIQPYVGGIQTDRNLILRPLVGGGGAAAPAPSITPRPGVDDMALIRVPAGGTAEHPANFPLAMSMLWEHDVIIAPGNAPVELFHDYNWDWAAPGVGGDIGYRLVPVDGSLSFIVPRETGKCDLVYASTTDFTVAVERRV